MRFAFILLFISLAIKAEVPRGLNHAIAKNIPEIALKKMMSKITTDVLNVAKASLLAANGGKISSKADSQFMLTSIVCRANFNALGASEYRQALDNSLSGMSIANILTPTMRTEFKNCLDEFEKDLSSVDKDLIIPKKELKDFEGVLSTPAVEVELRKIDPYNLFLVILTTAQSKQQGKKSLNASLTQKTADSKMLVAGNPNIIPSKNLSKTTTLKLNEKNSINDTALEKNKNIYKHTPETYFIIIFSLLIVIYLLIKKKKK